MTDRAFDPSKTPGTFGAPPPEAPREVTTPGSERPTVDQIRMARDNERELSAYAPRPLSDAQMAAFLGKTVAEIQQMRAASAEPMAAGAAAADAASPPAPAVVAAASAPPPSAILRMPAAVGLRVVGAVSESDADAAVELAAERAAERAAELPAPTVESPAPAAALPASADALPPILPHQRAGSNSDTPSRGLPTPVADRGKQITGGFGDLGEAQYFPLDGSELGVLVTRLLDDLKTRIVDDLRFSLAATYPRVAARVEIQINAYGLETTMQIARVTRPHDKTPLEIARAHADEVCFVLAAACEEVDPDTGEPLNPPDAVRQQLRLPVPRKQAVQTPGGRMLVDVR